MPELKSWIKAARLRTLPLALSSMLTGSFIAIYEGKYNWTVIFISAFTTVLLQVLSNMANDYGDSKKGTDNQNRVGPKRTVQSGEISPKQMKKGVVFITIVTLFSGILLLYFAFPENFVSALVFFLIGVAAIVAAIKYTVGNNAYGYIGLGDLFVFFFFGIVGVIGNYFLNTHNFNSEIILPAFSIGFFSTGVLNLNNMRDVENDIISEKNTLASRLGERKAKIYHSFLIIAGIALLTVYTLLNYSSAIQVIFLFPSLLLLFDLVRIWKINDPKALDPYLRKLAIGTFLIAVFFGLSLIYS